MDSIEQKNDKQYLQEIFNARLIKCDNAFCPNCGASANENFRPSENRKLWYCKSCLKTVAPLVGTIFEQTQLPIELWLHIVRKVLEKGPDLQAKELHLEYGISMPTSYRAIEKVQTWQTEHNIHKSGRKRKIKRNYRTGTHLIYEMILRSMPPLFCTIKKTQTNETF